MKSFMKKLEELLEIGGIKKDVTLLVISGVAVILSLLKVQPFPFDIAWIAIVLCGLPIILEAIIGLVTAFDIKADVLVSLALLAGNTKLLAERDIAMDELPEIAEYMKQGCTITYVAIDGEFSGYLALSDTLRNESATMIDALSNLQVRPVLLTGDHENAAHAIAGKLHITDVRANCLPEDKLNYIGEYQDQNMPVCMIGDGINNAPALKKADVGIAMGGVGSDIAVDAADIALVDDEVKELPHLIALSKRMMITIKLNMTFPMTLNFVAIVLAIIGTLNPVVGALVHNAGFVLVITNSAFLLNWRRKNDR